ncbi:MAG: hypothetical protein R3D30_09100 [Hyphomicrobiales bacterium]
MALTTDVGDMVGLLAAGLVLFALLMASYSRRNTWIALGSAAFSLAALIGLLFLSLSPNSGQIRTALAELAKQVPTGLDQPVTDLAAAMEQTAKALSCEDGTRPVCKMLTSAATPTPPEPNPVPANLEPVQADATATFLDTKPLDTKPAAKPSRGLPIAWLIDEPGAQVASTDSGGFLMSGVNVSDQPLEKVRAVLKPDGGAGKVSLVLQVEGLDDPAGAIIPPGAKFSLVAPNPNTAGGAILSFSYVLAGQRRTSIRYLTPDVVARSAEAPSANIQQGP